MVSELLAAIGVLSLSVMLLVLAGLSRRLGRVTRARPYYVGLILSAGLVFLGFVSRVVRLFQADSAADLTDSVAWVLLYHGASAFGLTLGVMVAWRYWSWLLAERE